MKCAFSGPVVQVVFFWNWHEILSILQFGMLTTDGFLLQTFLQLRDARGLLSDLYSDIHTSTVSDCSEVKV